MPAALAMFFSAVDDAALAHAVFAAGGADAALYLLFDAAYRLQCDGGSATEIMAMVGVSDRVAALARRQE